MASYYVWSGATGAGSGASWTDAFTTLVTALVTEAAGDTLYVAHDHVESAAGLSLLVSGTLLLPTKIICVDRTGSVPPISADRRATAQLSSTTSNAIVLGGEVHFDGFVFTAGSGANSANINFNNGNGQWVRLDNCQLKFGGTGSSSKISITGHATYTEWNNTTITFVTAGQCIIIAGALKWRNTPAALSGPMPPVLFTLTGLVGGDLDVAGVDLSAAGAGVTLCGVNALTDQYSLRFADCKINAAVTKAAAPTAPGASEVDFVRCAATGINYSVFRQRMTGALNDEATVVRTGGASNGTTITSWKIDTTANCCFSLPFECPPVAIWNDNVGSVVTATVEGIWGGGAVPNNNDVWVEVEYLGSASSPLGSFINDGPADLLTAPAAQDVSSATWGGSTTKFKLVVTFTAQQKGWIYARIKCAKPSTTFYIDPLVVLS